MKIKTLLEIGYKKQFPRKMESNKDIQTEGKSYMKEWDFNI